MRATGAAASQQLMTVALVLLAGAQVGLSVPRPNPSPSPAPVCPSPSVPPGEVDFCDGNVDNNNNKCNSGGVYCALGATTTTTPVCGITITVSTNKKTVTWTSSSSQVFVNRFFAKAGDGFNYKNSPGNAGSISTPNNNGGNPADLSHAAACVTTLSPRSPAPEDSNNGADGVADPHFTGFDGTSFDFGMDGSAKGKSFALLSMRDHLLNTYMDSAPGPMRWPFWGTWMRGFGFRYADILNFELVLLPIKLPSYNVTLAGGRVIERPTLPEGGFASVMALSVNGQDVSDALESGVTYRFGGSDNGDASVIVHLPGKETKHKGDPQDGPVLVFETPAIKVVLYSETEEVLHLDLHLSVKGNVDAKSMHGVVGQTMRWKSLLADRTLEGKEADYETSSLLAEDFKFSTFNSTTEADAPSMVHKRSRVLLAAAGNLQRTLPSRVVCAFVSQSNHDGAATMPCNTNA